MSPTRPAGPHAVKISSPVSLAEDGALDGDRVPLLDVLVAPDEGDVLPLGERRVEAALQHGVLANHHIHIAAIRRLAQRQRRS